MFLTGTSTKLKEIFRAELHAIIKFKIQEKNIAPGPEIF